MPHALQKLAPKDAEALAWQFVLAAHGLPRNQRVPAYLSFDAGEEKVIVKQEPDTSTCLYLDQTGVWCCSSHIPSSFRALFDLYLPVLGNRETDKLVVAHLGQSIDSQIATVSGDSFYVTGEQNRKHLHCLRALSDAVIVGASTILADDPQLTTRAVPGNNPVRVVIDPHARLKETLGVFNDEQARTVLVHQSSADLSDMQMQFGPIIMTGQGVATEQVERWVVPDTQTQLPVERIIAMLASNNLQRLFVEGGGITVSRFFDAGSLDRLHVAVAPLLVGKGTQGLQISGVETMINAHRPPCAIYRMGEDILWDFDVSAMKAVGQSVARQQVENAVESDQPSVQRIV